MIVRCTAKVLALLEVQRSSPPELEPAGEDWYVGELEELFGVTRSTVYRPSPAPVDAPPPPSQALVADPVARTTRGIFRDLTTDSTVGGEVGQPLGQLPRDPAAAWANFHLRRGQRRC